MLLIIKLWETFLEKQAMLAHKRLVPLQVVHFLQNDKVVESMKQAEILALENASVSWYELQYKADPSQDGGILCYDNIRRWEVDENGQLVLKESMFTKNAYHVKSDGSMFTTFDSTRSCQLQHCSIISQILPGCVPLNYVPISENFVFVGDTFRTSL